MSLMTAIKRLGRCVAYYPALSRVVGLKESIFLCQLIYWTPKASNDKGDGWIYKSVEALDEETGLSYKEQKRIRQSLKKQGLLDEQYDRNKHLLYYKVNTEALDLLGEQMPNEQMPDGQDHLTKGNQAPDQKEGGTLPKVSSYKEAEITTEITQENTQQTLLSAPPTSDQKPRDLVGEGIKWVFDHYVRKLNRNPKTYLFSNQRKSMLKARLKETIAMKGDIVAAVNFMTHCTDAMLESDWHMGRDPKTNGRAFNEIENIFGRDRYQQWVTQVERDEELED